MPDVVPADALTTIEKVKDFLGIAESDTSSDDFINQSITYVTALIKSFCGGRQFLEQEYEEIYDSFRGRRKIFLKQRPVSEVTDVSYRSGTPTNPVWISYNADGYLPYLPEGYIHFYAQLPQVAQGFKITYTAGYLIDFTDEFDDTKHTLPQDITMAATEMIGTIFNTRKAAGISSETTEGQTISYSLSKMTDTIKNALSNYKMIRIAR